MSEDHADADHRSSATATSAGPSRPRPRERGERTPILGRPAFDRHDRAAFAGADLVIDASRGEAVRANVEAALDAGVRRFVIATTGWAFDRDPVERALRDAGCRGGRLGQLQPRRRAVRPARRDRRRSCSAPVAGFDPFLVEWHRRAKADRPSGTALGARPPADGPPSGAGDAGRPRGRLDPGRARRRACTSSASMPPARPSSSG